MRTRLQHAGDDQWPPADQSSQQRQSSQPVYIVEHRKAGRRGALAHRTLCTMVTVTKLPRLADQAIKLRRQAVSAATI